MPNFWYARNITNAAEYIYILATTQACFSKRLPPTTDAQLSTARALLTLVENAVQDSRKESA